MAKRILPPSGRISLNDIHVEAGGTTGTNCSINDSDIRGLIGKGANTRMSFSEWYGASASLGTSGLTIAPTKSSSDEYGNTQYSTGYSAGGSGSMEQPTGFYDSDGDYRQILSLSLFWAQNSTSVPGGYQVTVRLASKLFNRGWSTMTLTRENSSSPDTVKTTFRRVDATYSQVGSGSVDQSFEWPDGGLANWATWRGYITFA